MDQQQEVKYRVTKVWCRRLGRQLPVDEHQACPYCFDEDAVTSARHAGFCDFRPEEDPINFGFPEDRGRYRR